MTLTADNRPPVGISTTCARCGAGLQPHNLTGLCSECKLVTRNQRLTGKPADAGAPVTRAEAIANIEAVLGGRIISEAEADR
jgi:hypothetical protein